MELIDEYLEHLRRAGKAQSTIDGRREILGRLDRDMDFGVGQVSTQELATWLYRDEWERNTRYTYWSCLHDFYGWAADPRDPWISDDPTAAMEPVTPVRGVARPCRDEHLAVILTRAREPYRTWATMVAYQGLRCVEISRMDREHVSEQSTIVLGKGGKFRVQDTDPDVWRVIEPLPAGPVARHQQAGERATPFYISSTAATYFRTTLKVPVSMHMIRHWFGVNVQKRFKDIAVTKAMLGHASLTSTQIYVEATDEQQRAARATLPRFS